MYELQTTVNINGASFGIRNDGYGCNLNVVQKTKFILNNLKTQKTIVYVTNYSKAYEYKHWENRKRGR